MNFAQKMKVILINYLKAGPGKYNLSETRWRPRSIDVFEVVSGQGLKFYKFKRMFGSLFPWKVKTTRLCTRKS